MDSQRHRVHAGRPRPRRHERDETAVLEQDHGLGDIPVALEHGRDLARLDPVAPDLHLVVEAPEEVQGAVLTGPHTVAAAVPAPPPPGDEGGLGQGRFTEIPGRQPDPGDEEFTGLAGPAVLPVGPTTATSVPAAGRPMGSCVTSSAGRERMM